VAHSSLTQPSRRRSPARRLLRNLTRWISIDYFKSMRRRIGDLEVAVDTLLFSPTFVFDESVGLNGQTGRKQIFRSLAKECRFDRIIETGTFIGDSAGWLQHVSGLPVYTSEINRRFHALACKRLATIPAVQLTLGNSVDFLRQLAESSDRGSFPFFYLDAHWYKDLPLARELQVICSNWEHFVIMVDDFEVPGDEGYRFDDYGFGRSLTVDAFRRTFERLSLQMYFPALPSRQETGACSGSIVLARKGSTEEKILDQLPELNPLNS